MTISYILRHARMGGSESALVVLDQHRLGVAPAPPSTAEIRLGSLYVTEARTQQLDLTRIASASTAAVICQSDWNRYFRNPACAAERAASWVFFFCCLRSRTPEPPHRLIRRRHVPRSVPQAALFPPELRCRDTRGHDLVARAAGRFRVRRTILRLSGKNQQK
jgi:hypothetical protein